MAKSRNELVKKYLTDAGCMPGYSGYDVLMSVILLQVDDPSLNCTELFAAYATAHPVVKGQSRTDGWWRKAYKRARYCFLNSAGSAGYAGVYSFIRQVSSDVRHELSISAV